MANFEYRELRAGHANGLNPKTEHESLLDRKSIINLVQKGIIPQIRELRPGKEVCLIPQTPIPAGQSFDRVFDIFGLRQSDGTLSEFPTIVFLKPNEAEKILIAIEEAQLHSQAGS